MSNNRGTDRSASRTGGILAAAGRLSPARHVLRPAAIALVAVIAGILARKLLLSDLETRIVWVTFYPAVVFAALFGGFFSGLLTAGFSCLVAVYGCS